MWILLKTASADANVRSAADAVLSSIPSTLEATASDADADDPAGNVPD